MTTTDTQTHNFAPYVEELREQREEYQAELDLVLRANSIIDPIREFATHLMQAGELVAVDRIDKHAERPGVTLTTTVDGRGLVIWVEQDADNERQLFVTVAPDDFSDEEYFDIEAGDPETGLGAVYRHIVEELAEMKGEEAVGSVPLPRE